MSNLYRTAALRRSPPRSRRALFVLLALVCVGIFIAAVFFFRKTATSSARANEEAEIAASAAAVGTANAIALPVRQEVAMSPAEGMNVSGTAIRAHADGLYGIAVAAGLPVIDAAIDEYQVWLMTPGIVDVFSLGTMFIREDGAYGLRWEVTDAAARSDIADFTQLVILRSPREATPGFTGTTLLTADFAP